MVSHVRLREFRQQELHKLTVPDHKALAKGTVNGHIDESQYLDGLSKDEWFLKRSVF